MPRALALSLALLLALPATAAGARRAAVVVVVILPPAAEADDDGLSLVMQARAAALLVRAGGFVEVHAKQILRVAEREGLSRAELGTAEGAAIVARRFGAERVVRATLARQAGGGWLLTAEASPTARTRIKLAADAARAVDAGALALARLAAGGTVAAGKPASASGKAVAAYARCYGTVVEQPLLVDTPMVLDDAKLTAAVADCRAAVAADPGYADAAAALGLALALSGKDDEAVETLARVKEGDGYLPLYWFARYWVVTRYQSPDVGTIALTKAIELHPYFLLARGYLAEHESALHHDAAALEAWRAYQKELPRSAYVRDGASRSLARLGRHDEAIAEAKGAVADHPDDTDAKLELASRYVDAKRDAEAIAILAPLAASPKARAETKLRLGFAYARQGDAASANKWLGEAETAAQRPDEWRTRARARLDRGVLLIKTGRTDEGQALLVSAERAGLARYIEKQKDEELLRLVKEAEVAQRDKKVLDFSIKIPTETSPFPLDGTGELDPPRRPPPAPKMFEVLRF
jgi:tetratricopeptide (TPR) repeat protein